MKIAGRLKVYLDGEPTPRIDQPVEAIHPEYPYHEFWQPEKIVNYDRDHPAVFPFVAPLCTRTVAQLNWCLVPIPFAQSVRVVLEHDPADVWVRYDLLWTQYPEGTKVTSFSLESVQAQEADVWAAAKAWRVPGTRPCLYPDEQRQAGNLALPPGATVDLWQVAGAGTIVSLRLKATPWNRAVDRLTVLRAYWDGEVRPSVECPLGDLCTSHVGVPSNYALPAGRAKDGWYYFYLPMPYASSARLTLQNCSRYALPSLDWEIVTRPGPPAAEAGRFCARWKREKEIAADGHYELLGATGAGKLVGYNLYLDGFRVPMDQWNRPGQMAFYVDEEAEPNLAGSPLLAYWYNGHYGGPNASPPLAAVPSLDYQLYGYFGAYRFFLTDAPTWTQSARLVMSVAMDEITGRDFTSVAYWYRSPGGSDSLPALPTEDLALPVRHFPGSFEAEDLVKTAEFTQGDLLIVEDPEGRYGAGHNRFVSYAPLGPGDALSLRLPVEEAGKYRLKARLLVGPSGGFWGVSVNGSPIDPKQPAWGCYAEETTIAWWYGWFKLGEFDFRAGENAVTFVSRAAPVGSRTRGLLLGLDALLLERGN